MTGGYQAIALYTIGIALSANRLGGWGGWDYQVDGVVWCYVVRVMRPVIFMYTHVYAPNALYTQHKFE